MNPGLSTPQVQRLVNSMYCVSIRSQELLQQFSESCQPRSSDRQPCDLVELIAEVIGRASPAAASRSVDIRQCVPSDLVTMVEPRRIESVLDNLLNNAIEALPAGDMIHVAARRHSELAIVEVRDTGRGVSNEIRHKLFRPFATAGKKNGLGLALSEQTVRRHGGRMWLKSEPGWGACFSFSLPIDPAPVQGYITVKGECNDYSPNEGRSVFTTQRQANAAYRFRFGSGKRDIRGDERFAG